MHTEIFFIISLHPYTQTHTDTQTHTRKPTHSLTYTNAHTRMHEHTHTDLCEHFLQLQQQHKIACLIAWDFFFRI